MFAEAPNTPSAPQIKPERHLEQLEENTPFHVTCRGDVGAPLGELQLVSNGSLLNGFELVPEGCGAQVPSCYRFNGTANVTGGRNATATWWLPGADASADGVALWCRAVHTYSSEKPLSANASTLRVYCMQEVLRFIPSAVVRRGSPVTIQCRPTHEDPTDKLLWLEIVGVLGKLVWIGRFNNTPVYNPVIAKVPYRLTYECEVPVLSATISQTSLRDAGNYVCHLYFTGPGVAKHIRKYGNLVVWGVTFL